VPALLRLLLLRRCSGRLLLLGCDGRPKELLLLLG
jgi:hypothetical protein